MSHINIYRELLAELTSGRASVLVRIIRKVGSAPRTAGAALLLKADGSLSGTIGGGRLEHEVLGRAREVLETGRSAVMHVRLSGTEVAASEMLCGGDVDVLLEPVERPAEAVLRELLEMKIQGRRGALVSMVAEGRPGGRWFLVAEEGAVIGDACELGIGDGAALERWAGAREPLLESIATRAGHVTVYVEPVGDEAVLMLFGAGHISTFVAPLAARVGFSVCVIDDRDEFANPQRFPTADRLMVCPVAEAFERIAVTPATYIVIVTRGHVHDRDVLRAALNSRPAYLGMIGSRRKRELIYASLMDEGVAAGKLAQVYCPIGIAIGAQTPEEIAVSIVAELIQVRAHVQADRTAATEML
jgi:xanthine dehydrogenase accessory factor